MYAACDAEPDEEDLDGSRGRAVEESLRGSVAEIFNDETREGEDGRAKSDEETEEEDVESFAVEKGFGELLQGKRSFVAAVVLGEESLGGDFAFGGREEPGCVRARGHGAEEENSCENGDGAADEEHDSPGRETEMVEMFADSIHH